MSLSRLFVFVCVTCMAWRAHANPYEIEIDISSEEDLYELLVAEQISDDTFQVLVELLQRGVDLNTASRQDLYTLPNLSYDEVDAIIAYRKEIGFIADPGDLVTNDVLSDSKLGAIAAFILVTSREPGKKIKGWARMMLRTTLGDDQPPPALFQSKVRYGQHLTFGIAAILDNNRIRDVVFDPTRNTLSAPRPSTRPRIPKGYVRWQSDKLDVVVGSFRTGFGQRLTFDKTDIITPDGHYGDEQIFYNFSLTRNCRESAGELDTSPCAGDKRYEYETPDFRSRTALVGASVAYRDIPIGKSNGEAHGFISYTPQDIYQYELYDQSICDDPRNDNLDVCSSPQIIVQADDLLSKSSQHSFQTLSAMYSEFIAGAHLKYKHDYRSHVGLTGYGSTIHWLPQGIELGFQEWSRRPFGGAFGAVGMDAAYGLHDTDLTLEVSRSFDSMTDGGGGLAAIAMAVTDFGAHELQSSLRYYDSKFANPHARPISAPDEFDGLRARDEIGARFRYTGNLKNNLNLRGNLDLWYSPRRERTQLLAYLRGDKEVSRRIDVGLWMQIQDRDLSSRSQTNCFEQSPDQDDLGDTIPCSGEKLQIIPRVRVALNKRYNFTLQYKHEIQDDQRYDDKYRQDSSFIGTFTMKPIESLRLKLRSRYLFDDISDNEYLEQSIWNYVEASYRLRKRDQLRLRYDLVYYLDDRDSSTSRHPSPEHWLWLSYKSNF